MTSTALPPGQWRPTWVEVDLDAIAANVAALKVQAAAPRLMAVVKADGYGHGMVASAEAALRGGADWLAVALVEEGVRLRDAGITAEVLVLAEPPVAAIPTLLHHRLTPAAYSQTFLAALDLAGRGQDAPVAIHLKLDTGMRRVGVPEPDWQDALGFVRDAPGLALQALWSHFAVADEPHHPFIAHQAKRFREGLDLAEQLGIRPDFSHLCNSAGTLHLHEEHHDMVRPGLAVYGLEPAPGLAAHVGLQPALSWYSQLSFVKPVAAGESVSYGLRWTAPADTTIATVPAGYADGVVRALSNQGEVLVAGQRMPIRGTVCMDQFLVELPDASLQSGELVCLLGRQGSEQITADEWATRLHTINYEIVCGIGPRVPRIYVSPT